MSNLKRRIFALIMTSVLLAGVLNISVYADDMQMLRGAAAKYALDFAEGYGSAEASDVIKGDSAGNIRADEKVIRLHALVMLSRAFGKLPEPKGAYAELGVFPGEYTDVPAWAKSDIDNLRLAGVLTYASPELGVNEPMTYEEYRKIAARIWAVYGTNLKDDYYAAVNKEFLENTIIPAGYSSNSAMRLLQFDTDAKIEAFLDEILSGEYEAGTKEQIVSEFYASALDMESRNEQGAVPLIAYMQGYNNAKSIGSLLDADIEMLKETGFSALINYDFFENPEDSSQLVPVLATIEPTLDKSDYEAGGEAKLSALKELLTRLQVLTGVDEKTATKNSELYIAFEKEFTAQMPEPQDYYDIEKILWKSSVKELESIAKGFDVLKRAKEAGLTVSENDVMYLYTKDLSLATLPKYTESNLELLRNYARLKFMFTFGKNLSQDFVDAFNDYDAAVLGVKTPKTNKQLALEMTKNMLSDYVGQIYVEKLASPRTKEEVTKIIHELVDVYRSRVSKLDWMSDETKAKAIVKLDNLNLKVGYPDEWQNPLDGIPFKEGGGSFDHIMTVKKAGYSKNISIQDTGVDKTRWDMPVYLVNAYYNPTNNEICIPIGICLPPFYDESATKEYNLGGIGATVGHEISHAFDRTGAEYDEKGNYVNWWTEADYKAFGERCMRVIEFFDGYESAAGIDVNGELTLSENVADLGAISSIMELAKQDADFDYDDFFRSYSNTWQYIATRKTAESISKSDVHAYPSIRVNATLPNFDEFYKEYEVSEGDGMYVPPEKRVEIW